MIGQDPSSHLIEVGIAQDHGAPEGYERNHRFEGNTYEGGVVLGRCRTKLRGWRGFGNDLTGIYCPA